MQCFLLLLMFHPTSAESCCSQSVAVVDQLPGGADLLLAVVQVLPVLPLVLILVPQKTVGSYLISFSLLLLSILWVSPSYPLSSVSPPTHLLPSYRVWSIKIRRLNGTSATEIYGSPLTFLALCFFLVFLLSQLLPEFLVLLQVQ